MPNHTSTKLIVTGYSKKISALIELVKGDKQLFSCEKVLPMPSVLTEVRNPVHVVKDEKALDEWMKNQKPFPGETKISRAITKEEQREYLAKYGADNWYDWARKHWGSKWDVYEVGTWRRSQDKAEISWLSAWTPISPIILKLSEVFPTLTLVLKFADEGGNFLGYQTFHHGKHIDVPLAWKSEEGIELRKELGCYYEDENA